MTTLIQRSFSGGEISPSLRYRVDFAKYQTALTTLRNAFVGRHGGVINRPGTRYVGETKYTSDAKPVRLVPFKYSSPDAVAFGRFGDVSYVLEFGDLYVRFIQLGRYVTDGTDKIITAISKGSFTEVTTSAAHGYSNGNEVKLWNVSGMEELNNRQFTVGSASATTFRLLNKDGTNVDSAAYGSVIFQTYPSFAGLTNPSVAKIFELVSPYAGSSVSEINYVQSLDVLTITHPNYPVQQISFNGSVFSITAVTFAPTITIPLSVVGTQNGTPQAVSYHYQVTAIAAETYEESLPSTVATVANGNAILSATDNISLTWNAPATGTPQEYNVYKSKNGIFGFIGTSGTARTFVDTGIIADTSETPPIARNPFSSINNYPSTVSYIQQRLAFGNTRSNPETVWLSKVGQFKNFTISSPLQDDDAITFQLAGIERNPIRHLRDVGQFIVLTANGEWAVPGGTDGTLSPTALNPKQYTYNGSSFLPPLIIDGDLLYVQERGSAVRDLAFTFQVEGYRGSELSVFASHLTDAYGFLGWTYQKVPTPLVWMAREDGILVGLTFMKEQEIIGWHRHDTDGLFLDVCSVPEGRENITYFVVEREINGVTRRFIERMASRTINSDSYDPNVLADTDATDLRDSYDLIWKSQMGRLFSDCSYTFDGRNNFNFIYPATVTLSGGSTWTASETLTLTQVITAPAANVQIPLYASNVGDTIRIYDTSGNSVDCELISYVSQNSVSTAITTVFTAKPNKDVGAAFRTTALYAWSRCVTKVNGLWHLEGKSVSVLADGYVLASPNNPEYDLLTVQNGKITLDAAYGVIHVGLPYISDVETLDADTADPKGQGIANKKKFIGKVQLSLEDTRGVWVGAQAPVTSALQNLQEFKVRETENYGVPTSATTGKIEVVIDGSWNSNGRVFIRQVDPLPMTVLSVTPDGLFPFRG